MSQLKTLKDIAHYKTADRRDCEAYIPDIQELKKELIEYIKIWETRRSDMDNAIIVYVDVDDKTHGVKLTQEVIDFIKITNNITETDLK